MCLGIPGKVVEVYSEFDLLMGKVDFGGVIKRVCLEHTPEIRVGDYAVIHVGFAISRLDEDEARRVFSLLQAMDELDELGNEHEFPSSLPSRPLGEVTTPERPR